MTKDIEETISLTPLADETLRAAVATVSSQPDADALLAMLGLDEAAP